MTKDNLSAIFVIVDGIVQGVGFRSFAVKTANKFSIAGFVQNLKDGTVKILAQGSKNDINEFLNEIKNAPRPIDVEKISAKEIRIMLGLKRFEIVTGTMASEMMEGFDTLASIIGEWGKD